MVANLARAHALLSLAQRDAPDRRRFKRIELDLSGRLLDRNGDEHDCRTLDISPGDARITSSARARLGERLIVYLKDVGRVEAEVVRELEGASFAVLFNATTHKRERIAEQLTVLINPDCEIGEERRQRRFSGAGAASLELEDGAVAPCEILDFSLVGIAVKCARRPMIGAWVKVGNQYGRVSRYLDQGFAIDFENRPGS
jgi:hypothetical protein